MDEPLFAYVRSLLESLDVLLVLVILGIALTWIPIYLVRFRNASSVVGPKVPGNLRSFHVRGSAAWVRDAIKKFAHDFGYAIPHTDELRGLLVLSEKQKWLLAPNMLYSIFLNQPAADQTLVSVGCHSPLSGWVVRGAYPGPNSRWQNNFLHKLAGELISRSHASAPKLDLPQANPIPALEEEQAKRFAKAIAPIMRTIEVGIMIYIVATTLVFIEWMQPLAHESLIVTGRKSWATQGNKSGRINHYLLFTSSPRWPEHYTNADVYEHAQKDDRLDVSMAPWSLNWLQVTVLRNGEVSHTWRSTSGQNAFVVYLRLFGVVGGALYLYALYKERSTAQPQK